LDPHNFPVFIGVGVGFELWIVSPGLGFGNVYVGTDESAVRAWNAAHPLHLRVRLRSNFFESDRRGFGKVFGEFIDGVSDAFGQLFEQSPIAGFIVTSVLIIGLVFLCSCPCFGSAPPPVRPRAKLSAEEWERRRKLREQNQVSESTG
jgi:hypothetical protein